VWQPCLRALGSSDLVIVEQASRLLLNYVLLGWRPFGGPKVAFWGHGINLDRAGASRPGEFVKRRVAAKADWWFCYTEGTARIVEAMGVPRDRRTVVQNAVDTTALGERRGSITEEDCVRLRAEMGIGPGPIGISLGSIYGAKRPSYLVEASDAIRSRVPDFELIVIGDGPDRSIVDRAAATRPWIHPVGALTGSDMVRHAALGSVMLNPGLVGLAVLDAFALGLPLVTCDLPYHSPEIEYLVDGENGAILPEQTSARDLGEYVSHLLSDHDRRERLQAGAARSANTYTIENMVDRFADGVLGALSHRPLAKPVTRPTTGPSR
jgi:L-malate glycosyltransferase